MMMPMNRRRGPARMPQAVGPRNEVRINPNPQPIPSPESLPVPPKPEGKPNTKKIEVIIPKDKKPGQKFLHIDVDSKKKYNITVRPNEKSGDKVTRLVSVSK